MRNTTPTRVLGIVAGSLCALLALVLLLAGGGLLRVVDSKSSDGYFATRTHQYATPTRAIATQDIDLGDAVFDSHRIADVRIQPDRGVFIGIAPRAKVDSYLAGVAHDEIADLDFSPFDVSYRRHGGSRAPAAPASQDFWAATATGGRTLSWRVRSGHWSVVVMNADGSPGVHVGARVEAKVPLLHRLAVWMLIGGGLFALLGAGLLTLAAKPRSAVLSAV